MQLKEFVQQTLIQICQGIAEAQKDCDLNGALINPIGIINSGTRMEVHRGSAGRNLPLPVSNVSIEAAIEGVSSDTAGGHAGINVSFAGVNLGGDHADSLSTVNRVSFSVPVVFPISQVPELS